MISGKDIKNSTADVAIPKEEWKWFGSPGHFICARWCRFHLCTQVGKFLISTVGEYVHPRHAMGFEKMEAEWLESNPYGEDIGCGRKYETMVFLAGQVCTRVGCGCGMPTIDGAELDTSGYNTAGDATKGHMEMCKLFASKREGLL